MYVLAIGHQVARNERMGMSCAILSSSTRAARCYNSLFRRCLRSPSNFKAYNNVLSCEGLARSQFFKAQSQYSKP